MEELLRSDVEDMDLDEKAEEDIGKKRAWSQSSRAAIRGHIVCKGRQFNWIRSFVCPFWSQRSRSHQGTSIMETKYQVRLRICQGDQNSQMNLVSLIWVYSNKPFELLHIGQHNLVNAWQSMLWPKYQKHLVTLCAFLFNSRWKVHLFLGHHPDPCFNSFLTVLQCQRSSTRPNYHPNFLVFLPMQSGKVFNLQHEHQNLDDAITALLALQVKEVKVWKTFLALSFLWIASSYNS